jgi:hypothetical protein
MGTSEAVPRINGEHLSKARLGCEPALAIHKELALFIEGVGVYGWSLRSKAS